jgi:transketolase
MIGEGRDVALIALGPVARQAVEAAEALKAAGIEATVAVVSSLNPSPEEDLAELISGVPLTLTLESHYRTGGLGTFVAEVIADHGLAARLIRCGVDDMPRGTTGTVEWLNALHRLSGTQVAEQVVRALQPSPR